MCRRPWYRRIAKASEPDPAFDSPRVRFRFEARAAGTNAERSRLDDELTADGFTHI